MIERPILLEVSDELDTARLRMRVPRAGDGRMLHDSVVESLGALRQFPASLPWSIPEPTVEASETYARDAQARFIQREAIPLIALLRDTGEHVGNLAIHHIDWSVPKGEIGYWCRTRFAGKGLMREAIAALTDLGFALGLRRLQELTDEENVASCRLLERTGYVLEGVLHNERSAPDGALRTTRLYAQIR